MHKITGKQSRAARSLLQWNIYDLANRVKKLPAKRIDSFEHGMVHLMEWENDELVRCFKKQGIAFKADLEVALHKDDKEAEPMQEGMHGEGARIRLDADQTVLFDSSAEEAFAESVFP